MSKHTPGPWVVGPRLHGFDFSIVNPKGDAELGNWLVAGARWETNARLIAAAPDLLDALKAAQEELRLIRMKDTNAVYNIGCRSQISAAIAKAEGRT